MYSSVQVSGIYGDAFGMGGLAPLPDCQKGRCNGQPFCAHMEIGQKLTTLSAVIADCTCAVQNNGTKPVQARRFQRSNWPSKCSRLAVSRDEKAAITGFPSYRLPQL